MESPARDLLGETYSNPAEGFEIRPPSGWDIDESALLGTKVIFLSETPDFHDEAPFSANMNVVTGTVRELSLEEIVATTKEQLKTMLTDFTLLEETFLVVDGLEAHIFEYTFSQGVFPLRATQLIVLHEDTAYAITAGALSVAWDKYEAVFDASVRSLRFLPDSSPAPTLDQPYSDPTNGFEISPPYQWVVDQSGIGGTELALFHQEPDYHGETPFNANILVFVYPAEGLTLQEFVAFSKKESPLVLTNYVLLEEESAKVNDREVYLLESTFDQEEFPVRALQLIGIHEDQVYIVTAIALEDTWDKYEAVFDASLRSFWILADSSAPTGTPEPADSQSPTQPSQSYFNSVDGFQLQPPDGWAIDDSGTGGTSVIFYTTTPDIHGDAPFRANMSVSVWPADGTTLEELVPALREEYKRSATDFTLLEETTPIINGLETYVFDYTHSQRGFPLRGMQLAAIYEDKIYALTATALDGTWQKYEAVFEASFRSFKVLPDSPTPTDAREALDSGSPDLLDPPYSDSINGFEIRPPRDWNVDRSGLLGTKVAFLNPEPDSQGRSPFSANIVVYVEPAEGLTLEEFIELSKEQSPLLLKDYALLVDEPDTINGQAVRFLDATFTHGVYSLRIRQLIAIYEDTSYVITTTALDAAWQQYEAVFDASLRSFRILDTEDSEDS